MSAGASTSDFGQIRAFIAVAEVLSFSQAAATLGVSPSALSQTVRNLEARVGLRLLNRTTRSVSLTEAGRDLLHRARPAVLDLGEALDQATLRGGRVAGTVRVHSFASAAELFLRPMLRGFADRHPDVVLDLTVDDAVVDLVADGYDAGLRIGEVVARDMVAVPLGPALRQIAVASPDYVARHGAPASPRDLLAHRCIRWRWPGQAVPYAWEFQEGGRWFAVAVEGPLIASSRDIGIAAAVDGVGIAFTVEAGVAPLVAEGRLVPLLEPWSAAFPGYVLCYPAQRHMAPALRAFIDAVRGTARSGS